MGTYPSEILNEMGSRQRHRGPDGSGTLYFPEHKLGLAHQRLAIIDLTPEAAQPMWDLERRAVICFNGEIYNYRELREQLQGRGFRFRTRSDTEVLLNLYLSEGVACLSRLNGIFAFALWDTRSEELLLARDPFGVKPLYYASTPRGVIFASEIKTLMADESLPTDVDQVALQHYLNFLWCPAPRTLLQHVRKLAPGTYLQLDAGGRQHVRYCQLPHPHQVRRDWAAREAAATLRELLHRAVQRQLIADVPVGILLSGGLDSTALAALAGRPLECFTVNLGSRGLSREGFDDDLSYARLVARRQGLHLHEVELQSEQDLVDMLDAAAYHLDEPQADPAALITWKIAQLAHDHGIKVVLSGTGGDDLFGGYRRHVAWRWNGLIDCLPGRFWQLIRYCAHQLPLSGSTWRRVRRVLAAAALPPKRRLLYYYRFVSESVHPGLIVSDQSPEAHLTDFETELKAFAFLPPGDLSPCFHMDMVHFLADHNLNYLDKMAMAAGVEGRVPFLDPDLVTFAASLPDAMKVRGLAGKWLLRKAMAGVVPPEVLQRSKTGFGAPVRSWFESSLSRVLLGRLKDAGSGLFDAMLVAGLCSSAHARRDSNAAYTLLTVYMVESWLGALRYHQLSRSLQ